MLNWLRKIFRSSPKPLRTPPDSSAGGVYSGLRDLALSTQRSKAGIAELTSETAVWGILMETGYPGAVATLFALADGTTSLYLSTGGGVIGGQGHQSVRDANATFLETANQLRSYLQPTRMFPFPELNRIHFYALTDSGVYTAGGLEDDMGYGRHPLSPLFHAGHTVLTELRLTSENQSA